MRRADQVTLVIANMDLWKVTLGASTRPACMPITLPAVDLTTTQRSADHRTLTDRTVEFEGFVPPIGGLRYPLCTTYGALKLIAGGKLTFDNRVVRHRIISGHHTCGSRYRGTSPIIKRPPS